MAPPSPATDPGPRLAQRLGGRWATSLSGYGINAAVLVAMVLVSEPSATATARGLGIWMALCAIALLGDAMQLPFDDASFDKAISMNVMNVLEDKVALFREVLRVLKPGGRWAFLSGTFEFDSGDAGIRERLARGYLIPQFYDSVDGYKAKLRDAGFVVDEVLEYISDFRLQVSRWGNAYATHRDVIAAEQGEENTEYHIDYFKAYLEMVDAGKAANDLILSHRPA